MTSITTTVDDARRAAGIPRTRETPCAVDGCSVTDLLLRVNPKGEPGIFMCRHHTAIVG